MPNQTVQTSAAPAAASAPILTTQEEVSAILKKSVKKLFEKDQHLLDIDCSERSITHLLAIYLAEEFHHHFGEHFEKFSVDCEYNRNADAPKRLPLPENISSGDLVAKTVYPDIIVHERGNQDNNLLVVEVKKRDYEDETNRNHDLEKLAAFNEDPFRYRHSVYLVIRESAGASTPEFH